MYSPPKTLKILKIGDVKLTFNVCFIVAMFKSEIGNRFGNKMDNTPFNEKLKGSDILDRHISDLDGNFTLENFLENLPDPCRKTTAPHWIAAMAFGSMAVFGLYQRGKEAWG